MSRRVLQIHPDDDVLVALADLSAGEAIEHHGGHLTLVTPVRAKHKIALQPFAIDDPIIMYGVLVGRATRPIRAGEALTTDNVRHDAAAVNLNGPTNRAWRAPDASRFVGRTFNGYHRADGRVGTRNLWLVLPLVFCENRNVRALQEAFDRELGYGPAETHRLVVRELARRHLAGEAIDAPFGPASGAPIASPRTFPNIDGVRFLTHDGGCVVARARTRARALCGLLAGYLVHPNVAGATVLSLGCQHAQVDILREEIAARDPAFAKPLLVFEQQRMGTEDALMTAAVLESFAGFVDANRAVRAPAPLSALTVGLKCGGLGRILRHIGEPGDRTCVGSSVGRRWHIAARRIPGAPRFGAGLDRAVCAPGTRRTIRPAHARVRRPGKTRGRFRVRDESVAGQYPRRIADRCDEIGGCGAQGRHCGTAPVTAVLDYPGRATTAGLNLLCTPGNDVECTTAQAAAGANIILFTTGLGTPTGNPVAPVLKLATNSALAQRMPDTVDIDCGSVVSGDTSLAEMGEKILDVVIDTASGRYLTAAERLGQWDFIPWKRGVSL